MRNPSVTLLLLTLAAERLPAQSSPRTFVLRAGKDTISVEQVSRQPGRVEGELVFRAAGQRWHYVVTLGPDQRVTGVDNEFRLASDASSIPARQTARLIFAGDSVFVTFATGGATQRLGTTAGAVPYLNPSFGMVELIIQRALAQGGDSLSVPLFVLVGGVTVPAIVKRIGRDSISVSINGAPSHLAIARDGSIRGGGVPSQGLNLDVTDGVAVGALAGVKLDYSAPAGAPYTAQTVRVPTPMGHTLVGTLTLPSGAKGKVPAVVTITGSGPEDRDESIPPVKGYRPFREIADALGRNGVAVLRMDDRGFGESGGNFTTATSLDFADDIRAGLAYLRARPEIDGRRLGLVGHSEGGLIAPLVAAGDPELKGIVLMAGPFYTGRKIMEFQNRYSIDKMPNLSAPARDSMMTVALRGLDSATAASPWLKVFAEYDPAVTAKKVRTPVLILQGATDQQVTPDQAPLLEAALKAGGNRDVTSQIYPATNHLFLADPDGNPTAYSLLSPTTLRPEVLSAIVSWLLKRL